MAFKGLRATSITQNPIEWLIGVAFGLAFWVVDIVIHAACPSC